MLGLTISSRKERTPCLVRGSSRLMLDTLYDTPYLPISSDAMTSYSTPFVRDGSSPQMDTLLNLFILTLYLLVSTFIAYTLKLSVTYTALARVPLNVTSCSLMSVSHLSLYHFVVGKDRLLNIGVNPLTILCLLFLELIDNRIHRQY